MEQLSKSLPEKNPPREASCNLHGAYMSMHIIGSVWSRCPKCQQILREREDAERQRHKQEEERERFAARLGRSAIPKRFIGRTFEGFKAETEAQQKALAVCRDYAEAFPEHLKAGTGLILSGKPGTGKSHLAAAIMQSIIADHFTQYMTCMDVIRMIRETWRKDSERSESDVLRDLGRIPLVVIDEIGVQYGTEGEQTILFDVLDIRYRNQMPTILLTNQNMEGAKAFLGDRIWDRMRETCRWIPFDWESYRPQARKEAGK